MNLKPIYKLCRKEFISLIQNNYFISLLRGYLFHEQLNGLETEAVTQMLGTCIQSNRTFYINETESKANLYATNKIKPD